jgi:uncharacterized OsmC-like protein
MTQVQVKAKGTENNRQSISARAHSISADVAQEFGGKDSGPNPHELLLASLGACTSITLQMYAKRKGWDLQDVTVDLKDEEIEDPSQAGKKITKITREISIAGNLSQEEVDGLKAVADKCPIHKLLSGQQEIKTAIKRLTSV